jgi:exopolysaccharide biosynthesis polyprenyl glycosylphosphotransferase
MALGGTYERRHLGGGSEEYRRVLASAARFLSAIAILYLLLKVDVARGFVAFAIPVATGFTLLARYTVRRWLHRQRATGRFSKRVLVVGAEQSTRDLIRELRAVPHSGLAVLGACKVGHDRAVEVDGHAVPVLGTPDEVLDVVLATGADAVLVADGDTLTNGTLRRLAWQLEGTGVELMVAPEVTDIAGPRVAIRPVAGLPLLTVEEPELTGARRLMKEAFDRIFAAVLLLPLLPAFLVIGLAIRLSSPGPAIFKQVRVGLNGRHFRVWKFRTMTVDAEQQRDGLLHRNEHDGVLFKIRDDPRVTRLGRWLRHWSIDELPQLWNVLMGDMSVVGPRPPLPAEVENYSHRVRRRLLVKPGMTGLWQVSGRSGLPWEEAVRLDLYYVENWSPSMDATILVRTVSAVLRRQGAF